MQGTQVQSRVWEDPTYLGGNWVHASQLLSLHTTALEAHMPRDPAGVCSREATARRKPAHCNKEQPALVATRETGAAMMTQRSQK